MCALVLACTTYSHICSTGDSVAEWLASWLAAREIVSSTLPSVPVAQWGTMAWAAYNCDSCHVVVFGRLLTVVLPKPTQPSIPRGSVNEDGSLHSCIICNSIQFHKESSCCRNITVSSLQVVAVVLVIKLYSNRKLSSKALTKPASALHDVKCNHSIGKKFHMYDEYPRLQYGKIQCSLLRICACAKPECQQDRHKFAIYS